MKKVLFNGNVSVYADTVLSLPEQCNAVVIRCFRKSAAELEQTFRHLAELRSIYYYNAVILSIDMEKDKDPETLQELAKVKPPVPVIPLLVSGPGDIKNWTRCLNGPLAYMHHCGVRYGKVFNLSFEAQVDLESFSAAYGYMTDFLPLPAVSVRRTPEHLILEDEAAFLKGADPKHIQNILMKVVRFIRDGFEAKGGWKRYIKYLFRNTGTIWDFESLIKMRGFDPVTNTTGGQEELAMLCSLLAANDFDPSRVVNHHNTFWIDDPRLKTADPEEQKKKMRDEDYSVAQILSRYRDPQIITPDFIFS